MKEPRLINRRALRKFILEEEAKWGLNRKQVSRSELDRLEIVLRMHVRGLCANGIPSKSKRRAVTK